MKELVRKRTLIRWVVMIIIAIALLIAASLVSDNPITGRVTYSDLEDVNPTFTNIEATVYFTPEYPDDFEGWCSPVSEAGCFETTSQIIDQYRSSRNVRTCVEDRRAGWCCIPEQHRGFFEEIMCQGSGVYDGRVYHFEDIATTPQDSVALQGYERGITATQTDPEPKRTVAVNPEAGTDCYIEYGTHMYIYFGENNPWNGVYIAEDTGSAFAGECKIDIYAGVGRAAMEEARQYITRYPEIYLLDEEGIPKPPVPARVGDVSSVSGGLSAEYGYEYESVEFIDFFNSVKGFAEGVIGTCEGEDFNAKPTCANNYASEALGQHGLEVEMSCRPEEFPEVTVEDITRGRIEDGRRVRLAGALELVLEENEAPPGIEPDDNSRYIMIRDVITKSNMYVRLYDATGQIVDDEFMEDGVSVEEGTFLEFEGYVWNDSDARLLEVLYVEDISFGLTYYKKELLRSFALSMADCASSPQDSCYCNVSAPEGYNAVTFMSNRVLLPGASDDDFVELSIPVYPQDLSDTGNITRDTLAEFSYMVDDEGMLSFKKDEEEGLIAVLNNVEPELEACVPEKRHFLFCASQPDNPGVFRFSLKI